MIIWIASYPRSGNRYFRILLRHYDDIQSTSIYPPVAKSPEELRRMNVSAETFFVKTHELPHDDAPAIYLVRDGRDALISYTHFILNIEQVSQPFETILHDVISNPGYFGGWGNHVLAWTRRSSPTAIITFEELVRAPQPRYLLQKALQLIGKSQVAPISTAPPPDFAQLQQKKPLLFYRGQREYWKTEMSPQLHHVFWQIHGEAMQYMGYREGMI